MTAISQTQLRQLPPGTTPPLIIQYSASSVPILQIGLSSKTLPEQQLIDMALNFIRTQLITVEGAAVPFPYGGKQRLVSGGSLIPGAAGQASHAVDVVNAISCAKSDCCLPAPPRLDRLEHQVELNASPQTIAEFNDLPIKTVKMAQPFTYMMLPTCETVFVRRRILCGRMECVAHC